MIILIDDDPINNFIFAKTISLGKSQHFLSFIQATEALAYLRQPTSEVSLIFLDINMPEISGWDVLEELNRSQVAVDVIVVTSSVVKVHEQRARKYAQVKDYFVKPIREADKKRIEQYVESYLKVLAD